MCWPKFWTWSKRAFPDNFGTLRPFQFQTDRAGALRALDHFITHALPDFGAYQDAMLAGDPYLYHAVIGLYLNAGLLDPLEVCERAADAYAQGHAPINSVEGFIRQIIGWREFIRGIYFLEGPGYTRRNALDHRRALPALFWGADTQMNCLHHAVGQNPRIGLCAPYPTADGDGQFCTAGRGGPGAGA